MCVQAVCVQGCVCVRVYIVSNFAIHSHFTVSTSDRREGGGGTHATAEKGAYKYCGSTTQIS